MKIERMDKKNAITISDGQGNSILVSYSTPVAGFISGRGYVRTNEYHSKTTSQHINQFLNGVEAEKVSQKALDNALKISIDGLALAETRAA